jgi:hypothetical protein
MSNIAQLLVSDQDGEPMTEADWDAERPNEYVNWPILRSTNTLAHPLCAG